MKVTSALASIIACFTATTMAQGPISPCTYTTTTCSQYTQGPTQTITVYEVPFTSTATSSFDCSGCAEVTVDTVTCGRPSVTPFTTTTFVYLDAQTTTTVDVCSPTA